MKLECPAAETRITGAISQAGGPATRRTRSRRKGAPPSSKNFSRTCKPSCGCGGSIRHCRAESSGTFFLTTRPTRSCERRRKKECSSSSIIQLNLGNSRSLFTTRRRRAQPDSRRFLAKQRRRYPKERPVSWRLQNPFLFFL